MAIEQRGVDTIPDEERTSGPRDIVSILLGSNLCLGVIVFGWLPVSFGLGWWASVTSVVAGTLLGTALTAPLALVSLRTGTNLSTSSGAQFGVRGRLRRLGRRPAPVARLHGADRVDRRRRDDGRPAPPVRRARVGPHLRRRLRAPGRRHRDRRGLRLPRPAAPLARPGRGHDRARRSASPRTPRTSRRRRCRPRAATSSARSGRPGCSPSSRPACRAPSPSSRSSATTRATCPRPATPSAASCAPPGSA